MNETPELLTARYQPAGPPEDAGARPAPNPVEAAATQGRTAHLESRSFIPQVETEAQGWKGLVEIAQPLP